MGFLSEGDTLAWKEAKEYALDIKKYGVTQFLSTYNGSKEMKGRFLWGDEIEYLVVHLDHENKKVKLSLRAEAILNSLQDADRWYPEIALWRPEYAAYMIEGTPGKPFGDNWDDFMRLEENMRERRTLIEKYLSDSERVLTIPNFPLLGCEESTHPPTNPMGAYAESFYVSDLLTHPHQRYRTLTRNIRERRGSNVSINVPIFRDENTVVPDCAELRARNREAIDGCVYMDAMVFGMGMCCLQCTIQCSDIDEARNVYDQLAVFAPIMMALTAGTVCHRGMLVDTDVRWHALAASVDDRTAAERGLEPLGKGGAHRISKSRYGSIDSFLNVHTLVRTGDDVAKVEKHYNDLEAQLDNETYERVLAANVDEPLARHIAHLFIRDPLVIYEHRVTNDPTTNEHFECIQSTNWQTVRFKPPIPPFSDMGWRVEFRPMEVQLTDADNAAFVVFIILLVRTINALRLNFYIPISKIDRNIDAAHQRDAVLTQKFCWRTHVCEGLSVAGDQFGVADPGTSEESPPLSSSCTADSSAARTKLSPNDDFRELSVDQIINGTHGQPGVLSFMRYYLSTFPIEQDVKDWILSRLDIISKRASGKLKTCASWQRDFITSHVNYKKNSIVDSEIAYDMAMAILEQSQTS